MGALTSLTKWIPEDDLLLKDAVEAGASLESLAKGAVCFSRRYTIRELQDRWRALLYDLDTSAEASARIVEIESEHATAASSLQKANQTCNSRGKESSSWKRKIDSVRSHYYAVRKRIHTEPCSADLGFLVSPILAGAGFDDGSRDQLSTQNKQLADKFSLEKPFSHQYGHKESGYSSGQNAFPELMRVDSVATNNNVPNQSYNGEHGGSADDKILDGTAGEGCLFGYSENIVSLDEAGCNVGSRSFDQNFQQKDFSHILGENLISVDNALDIHDIGQTNALDTRDAFKDDAAETNPRPAFDSTNDNPEGSVCADFLGNDNSSSHVPDSGGSIHLRYSCTPSGMPIWRSMEDCAAPSVPMDGQYEDEDQRLLNLDDDKKANAPGCDVASSETKLGNEICSAPFNNHPIMSEDLMDITGSINIIDFVEDLVFGEEKEISDSPCLNSLSSILLSSPHNINQDTIRNINQDVVAKSNDPGVTNILETCLGISDAVYPTEDNIDFNSFEGIPLLGVASSTYDYHSTSLLDADMPSTSLQTSNITKASAEFLICVLSTEQWEIPNNDHIIFPHERFPPRSTAERCTKESTFLASSDKVLSSNGRPSTGDVMKVKEDAGNVQPSISSVNTGSLSLSKVEFLHSCDGRRVEAESPKGISIDGVCKYAGHGVDEQNLCTSEAVPTEPTPVAELKEEVTAPDFHKHDDTDSSFASYLENHLQGIDHPKACPPEKADGGQKEANIQGAPQISLPPHQDLVSETGYADAVAIMSTSEQELQRSDSEDDIPHFSDIEALILDMELDPYGEESSLFSKEVYQRMDTRSTIRLEQSFHSHMNRSILSHGAFAIFYGRHLKYFIKDPEVSLGRETEDVKVDIDLGREGRANKISRRQAVIKMDEEGVFSLNNIGKFPIFVNGKEVPAKKRMHLLSRSVIEIKDMHFNFEVNESAVRQYITSLGQSSRDQGGTRFNWKNE